MMCFLSVIFFKDSTMVNLHQTTIWENMFETFSKHRTTKCKMRLNHKRPFLHSKGKCKGLTSCKRRDTLILTYINNHFSVD